MGLQKLLLGDQRIETEIQKRKIILGGYLTFLYFGVDFFFFVVNLFNPEGEPTVLLVGFIVAGISLLLIRLGYVDLAIFIQLIRANYVAFHFSIVDENPYETGVYLFFIPASLGSLAIFGYQERWKGLVSTGISFVLFLIAFFEAKNFSPDKAHFYFISNFFLVFIIGVLILIFYDQLASESENKIMQKNRELMKANSELDRFVYSVSHDLRAPLASILGLVNVYRISEGKEKDKMVELIHGRITTLDTFIRNILDYSRNSRLLVKREKIDFRTLIEATRESLRFFRNFENIRFELEIPAEGEFCSDPDRIKLIINNLITNSVRYADISKPDPFIRIAVVSEENSWRLSVTDNGIGIKREYQDKVFEMFYQANSIGEGSGLGLYIVNEAVNLLGGKISMQSAFGEGTQITISFNDLHR